MFTIPKCPYCGKERPWNYYGGVGPCNCEASKKARLVESQRLAEKKAIEDAEEHKRLHNKATGCCHEWVGCCNPAFTYCKKCGITYGQYMLHK